MLCDVPYTLRIIIPTYAFRVIPEDRFTDEDILKRYVDFYGDERIYTDRPGSVIAVEIIKSFGIYA